MRATAKTTALLCAVCAVCLAVPAAGLADAVWGTGLVFEASAPGYEGYYEYCYHIYWDTAEFGGHFSLFPPTDAAIFEDHLGVKFGQHIETGDLGGVIPLCECDTNPTANGSWGTIKALYR